MPPHAVGESVSVRTGLVRGAGCKLDRVCDASAEDCRPDVDLASLQPQSAYLSFERLTTRPSSPLPLGRSRASCSPAQPARAWRARA